MFTANSAWSVGISLTLLFVAGCGSGSSSSKVPTRDSVAVRVTYGGQPVTEGTVNLVMDNSGTGVMADLDATGTATLTKLPLGNYTVIVMPPAEELPDPERPTPVKTYDNIPAKVRSQVSSPLKAEVTAETESLEFELKN